MDSEIILILGGARSGKSRFAQQLATELGERVLFIATGVPMDEEMRRRIKLHQKARPKAWRTLETPTGVARAIGEHIKDADVVVLDCLTFLVSNLMDNETEESEALEKEITAELSELLEQKKTASLIIVSNEVGMGVVPAYPGGRAYRDLLGRANQFIARRADRVYLMIAGIPLELKALVKGNER
ncbi:MAG: bifunctional adenosylcobinamide kinase/adenosylcobinamide-phosphate guanylyltransferase [Dehalococcoidia bacterium]|nr:bifunctional adenosylcobinamide kinase/adenosylcobinamide-phosphate guanylyltransferase [Dehalococcoidia bacterium]